MLNFTVRLVAVINLDPQLTEIKCECLVLKVVGGSSQRKPTIPKSERKHLISGVVELLTGGGGSAVEKAQERAQGLIFGSC